MRSRHTSSIPFLNMFIKCLCLSLLSWNCKLNINCRCVIQSKLRINVLIQHMKNVESLYLQMPIYRHDLYLVNVTLAEESSMTHKPMEINQVCEKCCRNVINANMKEMEVLNWRFLVTHTSLILLLSSSNT